MSESKKEIAKMIEEIAKMMAEKAVLLTRINFLEARIEALEKASRDVTDAVDKLFDPKIRVGPVWPTSRKLKEVLDDRFNF